MKISLDEFQNLKTPRELRRLIQDKKLNQKANYKYLAYEEQLSKLQIEMIRLQHWILKNRKRVAVIFEGRDAAGKGGIIRRFQEHLNPRYMRLVALNVPTETEKGQWYFRRYIKELPNPGELVFFDRSWYNRAVVEPVMGFCKDEQYQKFMLQVSEFEHMLYEDGVIIIKFWLSISKGEQAKRFTARQKNELKRWKFSEVDQEGQVRWDKYTEYKEKMFTNTHTPYSPWVILKANDKKKVRLEAMRYVLSKFDYEGKSENAVFLQPDPEIVSHYFRSNIQLD